MSGRSGKLRALEAAPLQSDRTDKHAAELELWRGSRGPRDAVAAGDDVILAIDLDAIGVRSMDRTDLSERSTTIRAVRNDLDLQDISRRGLHRRRGQARLP